jgi:hypothetical protein
MAQVFFGIGAAKAGTGWLWHVLGKYPECGLPPIKELHFFDRRHLFDDKKVITPRSFFSDQIRRLSRRTDRSSQARAADVREVDALDTPFAYSSYLLRLGKNTLGEITPAYSLLPPAGFREMVEIFPTARFIFIMRDPVELLWSVIRYNMQLAERGRRDTRWLKQTEPNAFVDEALAVPKAMARGRYERTITSLESVVSTDRILYLFYENLFTADSMAKIENFLELPALKDYAALLDEKINSSRPAIMEAENRTKVRMAFASTFTFVERRFGRPKGWAY